MNFQEKLQDLRKEKGTALWEINSVKKEQRDELKKVTKSIEHKYSIKKEKYIKEFTKSVKDIHDYCKLIEDYSTFNTRDIGYLFADLMTTFEGKKYIFTQIAYHPDKSSPAQVQDILVLIEESNLKKINNTQYISERYYYHLIKYGKIVALDSKYSLCKPETLKFYKFKTGTINQNISLKGYEYLKEFIDIAINYRFENKIDEITEEELENLKNQFILLNRETIENNLYINAETDIYIYKKEIEDNLEHNKKLLKRRIQKIENK